MNLNVLKDSSEIVYYNNPSIPIYVRKGDLSTFPNKEALCHWHEDIEFLLPIKGHISYKVNGQTVFVKEGEAVFVNSRQMHYGYSTDMTDCEYICIVFNPNTLFPLSSIQNQYVHPILECNLTNLIIKADSKMSCQLLISIRQLYELYNKDTAAVEIKAMRYLYVIWESLYFLIKPFFLQELSSYDSNVTILKKMLSFIYNNYESKISLSDIAESGDIGKSKCCKLFKQYLNHSPNEYLNSYRLEKSMMLLRDPSLNITDIAYACGFSNPSYFSETFIKYKGCTPSAYRSDCNI
ncbi:AraC family transcriptional regulator [Anaeromicropila herbilytica]|uniref:HTH araC/xylS-type domain-containing protein n=1 Tax=Anaeromicropila herbilytica TaxID=2785025 RepID=A0A7R7IDI6_9FIRM|nr:helix-turn-helix domain-containing protein [Anaeromicropila herbilytica]BCN31114.1 hypothetical protein bsdtb5_24090 [Anaeromicropila herbilytica]